MNAAEEGNQGNAPKNQNNGWHPADHLVVRSEIEPWPEPVDGQALLDELARTVQRFVVLPQWAVEAYPAEVARLSILGAQTDKKWWCFEALFVLSQPKDCLGMSPSMMAMISAHSELAVNKRVAGVLRIKNEQFTWATL